MVICKTQDLVFPAAPLGREFPFPEAESVLLPIVGSHAKRVLERACLRAVLFLYADLPVCETGADAVEFLLPERHALYKGSGGIASYDSGLAVRNDV